MNDDMPESWIETSLDDLLVALESGSRPKGGVRGITSGIPSIGGEHLSYNGRFKLSNTKYVPEKFAKGMVRGHIDKNDILVVKDGATTGKVAFVDENLPYENAVVNEHVFICRPSSRINPRFLFRFLYSKEGQDRILNNFQGSAQGGINLSFAPNTKVVLAPVREQHRIVAKLEKLLAKVDKCKERLEKIPAILKRFRQSVLTAACSGVLTNDWRNNNIDVEEAHQLIERIQKKVRKQYLRDLESNKKIKFKKPKKPKLLELKETYNHVEIKTWSNLKLEFAFLPGGIFDGPFGSNLKTSDYTEKGVRVVRLENVGFLKFIDEKKTYISKEKYKTLEKHTVRKGDLIFSSFISENTRTVILPEVEKAIAKADCFCLRPIEGLLNPKYLSFLLSSKTIYTVLESYIHGATRPRINTTQLKGLIIPLPPFEEQKEIVRRVEALLKTADQVEARHLKAKVQVDKLTQAILAKAFRGELVPQDPNDEPASELLKRIKAEKAKTNTDRKTRKTGKR